MFLPGLRSFGSYLRSTLPQVESAMFIFDKYQASPLHNKLLLEQHHFHPGLYLKTTTSLLEPMSCLDLSLIQNRLALHFCRLVSIILLSRNCSPSTEHDFVQLICINYSSMRLQIRESVESIAALTNRRRTKCICPDIRIFYSICCRCCFCCRRYLLSVSRLSIYTTILIGLLLTSQRFNEEADRRFGNS